jgi:hypothetical protein
MTWCCKKGGSRYREPAIQLCQQRQLETASATIAYRRWDGRRLRQVLPESKWGKPKGGDRSPGTVHRSARKALRSRPKLCRRERWLRGRRLRWLGRSSRSAASAVQCPKWRPRWRATPLDRREVCHRLHSRDNRLRRTRTPGGRRIPTAAANWLRSSNELRHPRWCYGEFLGCTR